MQRYICVGYTYSQFEQPDIAVTCDLILSGAISDDTMKGMRNMPIGNAPRAMK